MDSLYILAESTSSNEISGWIGAIALIGVVLAIILPLILVIAAIVSILRSPILAGAGKAVWILLVLCFPLIGSVVWFIWGRNSTLEKPNYQQYQQYH